MKRLLPLLLLALSGCVTGRYYDYTFRLNGDNAVAPLSYEDDELRVEFRPVASNIGFTMLNKSGKDFKILWDEAVLVVADTSNRAVHGDVRVIFEENTQLPNTVIAGTYFKDLVTVTRKQSINTGARSPEAIAASETNSYYMLPNYDAQSKIIMNRILAMKGKHVKLYLPINVGGTVKRYIFDFEIIDVKRRPIATHA